jgi:hypothetical protein
MDLSKTSLNKIGSVCLFVNGFIFLFYALFVPAIVHGVHWLITLVAILFIVALPAIYDSLRPVQKVAAKVVVALLGFAMIVIIVSDLLFASSVLPGLSHDLAYASGNALFIICLLAIGVMALKGQFFKWFGYLSILTAIIGLSTYISTSIPQGSISLPMASLLLLGLWSLAFGFNMRRLAK